MIMNKKILIVDDEADVCESIGNFLRRRDYKVAIAVGGREAIDILNQETFPVVLLDLKMPMVDGWTVLQETRSNHPETKYIVVSGLDENGMEERCREAGAHDFIVKPIRVKAIYELLEKLY